jgi:hypothetical protein
MSIQLTCHIMEQSGKLDYLHVDARKSSSDPHGGIADSLDWAVSAGSKTVRYHTLTMCPVV